MWTGTKELNVKMRGRGEGEGVEVKSVRPVPQVGWVKVAGRDEEEVFKCWD